MDEVQFVKIIGKSGQDLVKLSEEKLLALSLAEMLKVQEYYKSIGRNPSDIELETIAQTWSEHCKHKVFNATIMYEDEKEKFTVESLFKSYIKKATDEISVKKDWLVSVFSDNAGIVSFNNDYDMAFKAETHNHPSALEPYGGASTGIGGVIRDILGVGLGAKPVANTDVFCFGNYDYSEDLPEGVLHPKRIAKGVRAGVRDYGNRMGIPTINGSIVFDNRYLGNPLVFCGTVGVMPKGMHEKKVHAGDLIFVLGGRTGRDGIHGVTFASLELEESSNASAVQIGNPIEEKKFLDVLLQARDKGLYSSITDCGGGGFSSAIGEMGEETGVEVHLERAPLKYKGLKPWEIWISESQERMILAVPKENETALRELCEREDVELTLLGEFTGDKMLRLFYEGEMIGEMDMEFLHQGLPKMRKKAIWYPSDRQPVIFPLGNLNEDLKQVLAMPNIASKETTIRMYDHEVQGGSVVKPLTGKNNDGPSDAAIVKPFFDSKKGIVISNGLNPKYGDLDPYWMAASEIDEAIRNIVAVGGNPERVSLLDNFCWGNPDDGKKMGNLVRAAKACYDFAVAFETPFISGKDSFYNEFSMKGKNISVPPTLLISAFSVIDDCNKKITMDLKEEGNSIYLVGNTYNELGGSHYFELHEFLGNDLPKVNAVKAKQLYRQMHDAIKIGERNSERIVKSCHDCSEGGLLVAFSEMAFAGDLGMQVNAEKIPLGESMPRIDYTLFSESNSRFVVEVAAGRETAFEKIMEGIPFAKVGKVTSLKRLAVNYKDEKIVDVCINELKKAWKGTLNW